MPPFFLPVDALFFWSMTVVMLVISIGVVRAGIKSEGLYSTLLLFSLGTFFYFLAIPLEKLARGMTTLPMLNHFISVPVTTDFHIRIFVMGLAGLVFFALGLLGSGFKSKSPDVSSVDVGGRVRQFESALWLMWLGLIAIMFIFFQDFLHGVLQSYEASYSEQYAQPLPTLICQLIELLNSILAIFLALKKRFFSLLGALCMLSLNFALSLLFKEKGPAVISLIGIGYLYFFFIRDRRLALAGMIAGICFGLFVLKPIYDLTAIYGFPEGRFLEKLVEKKPTLLNLDSAGPMALIAYTMKEDEHPSWGGGLMQSFSIFVPRFLWPDRPLDASEAIAKDLIPDWVPGLGMGYSPLIEGYMNFGFWFSFLEFFLFGFVWGWLWRAFMKAFAFYDTAQHLDVIYRVAGFYVLLLFFRGMISGTLKQAIMYIVSFGMALAGMQFLAWLWQRFHHRRMVA